ncbi:MAG: DUF4344 domain-containing metallopeptidase [Kofleriaceae bacterium]
MRSLWVCLALAGANVASAGPKLKDVTTHGIELEVPTTWVQTNDGKATMLTPADKKGRGITVTETDSTLDKNQIVAFAKEQDMQETSIEPSDRWGAKAFVVHGKVKGNAVDLLAIETRANHVAIVISFVKAGTDDALHDANLALLESVRPAGSGLTFTQAAPTHQGVTGYPPDVVKAFDAVSGALGKAFRFPRPLVVKVADCGVVNAFYNPRDHSISLCHELWDDVYALFKRSGMADDKVKKLTSGTVMFAFFHEFGHALVGEFALPITGKGEDAADEIATIILGQAKQFGRESALAGAAWFGVMSADPNHKNVFWDEHSFDEQRAITIACLLYGSDQPGYAQIMTNLKIPASRQARCVRDYKDRYAAWNKLLEPYAHK